MRVSLILLFPCFLSILSFSQEQKKPTQQDIQAQLKRAKAKASETIRAYEKKIAEAKNNNEDPAMIAGLEKNLATLKKMTGVLDDAKGKTFGPNKILPKTVYPVRKYVSPIIP